MVLSCQQGCSLDFNGRQEPESPSLEKVASQTTRPTSWVLLLTSTSSLLMAPSPSSNHDDWLR